MLVYSVPSSACGRPFCCVGGLCSMQKALSRSAHATKIAAASSCSRTSNSFQSTWYTRWQHGSGFVACAPTARAQSASKGFSRGSYGGKAVAGESSCQGTDTPTKHSSSSSGSLKRSSRSPGSPTGATSTGHNRTRGSSRGSISPSKASSAANPPNTGRQPRSKAGVQSAGPPTQAICLKPRQVTDAITSCLSVQELQGQVQQSAADMHYVATAAAIVKLQKLLSQQQLPLSQTVLGFSSKLLQQLWQLLQPRLHQCKPRQLANVIYSLCLMPAALQQQYSTQVRQLLLPAFMHQHKQADPQHVSNVLYGMAKCRQQMQTEQVQQLLEQLCSNLETAKPQEISNTLWAIATLAQQIQDSHLEQLLCGLAAKVKDARPQHVANSLWAVAEMGRQVDSHQLHQLVDVLVAKPKDAKPQNVANTLWAVATMGRQVQQRQLQLLVNALTDNLHNYTIQTISNTLWAVATMDQQLDNQQVQQLLSALVDRLEDAKPQEVSNTLWAVATMGLQLNKQQLRQMLSALIDRLEDASPQNVSNTLWAVATMGQQVDDQHQLQQLLSAFTSKMHQANAQNVSNTLWACAQLQFLPKQLLAAPQLYEVLPAAANTPKHLSQIAWACGELGYRNEQFMAALLQQAVQVVALVEGCSGDRSFDCQALCNICWSTAVLNLTQRAAAVLLLVQACRRQWDSMVAEEQRQLHQVHTWLLDCQLAGGQGLLGTLTQQQLQQCRDAWDAQMMLRKSDAAVSRFQQAVFEVVSLIEWLQSPQMEQLSVGRNGEVDGAALIDITARTADGVLLAIEADGPTHFRQPDGALMGPTQHRNRVLTARGYVVVSVTHTQWDTLWGNQQQQKHYIQNLVQAELQVLSNSPPKTTQQPAKAGRRTTAAGRTVKRKKPANSTPNITSSSTGITSSSGRVRRTRSCTEDQSSATSSSAERASQQARQQIQ